MGQKLTNPVTRNMAPAIIITIPSVEAVDDTIPISGSRITAG